MISVRMSVQRKLDHGLIRGADRKLCVAITLLAFCVCVQAVRAKTAHYASHSPQSRYFTASIKIAKFVPLEVVTPLANAIPVPYCHFQEPRLAYILPVAELAAAEILAPSAPVLPRSPPAVS